MNIKSHKLSLIFVVALAVGLILALAPAAFSANDNPSVTFWNMPFVTHEVSTDYVHWFEDYFAKNYPNVDLSTAYGPGAYRGMKQKYIMQAKSGKPDVIEGVFSNLPVYIKGEKIQPITKQFKNWDAQGNFYKSTIDAVTAKGEIWGIPYNTNARSLLYRRDILHKYNLPVPKTWDQLIKVASTITKKEKGMYGFAFTSQKGEVRDWQEFMSWYFQLNPNMYKWNSDKGRWVLSATQAQLKKVLQLYHDLLFATDPPAVNPKIRGGDWKVTDYGYTSGDYAMVPIGPWIYGHRTESEARAEVLYDSAVAPLPVAEGGQKATYMEVKPIMMNKYTKNPEAAWKVMKAVTSKESLKRFAMDSGFNPTRKDVANTTEFQQDWWQKTWLKQLPNGVAAAPLNWSPPRRAIIGAIQAVIYKDKTPKKAAADLYKKLQKFAKEGEL